MPRSMFLACFALSLCAITRPAESADWPQFRGPEGQGHSPERTLPLEWDQEKNIDWQVEVPGKGWSSPVVVGGRVYLTTAVASSDDPRTNDAPQSLRALCFDANTGKLLWDVEVFRQGLTGIHKKNSHASPTPIVDQDHVFTLERAFTHPDRLGESVLLIP